ncbi:MAG: S-methyl-5-thioribose-1-phosphate isomerase, partial [Deltaproteobacteria bacterium]|nr:S-methyl-5-thioribose-1-phosphate isomerase [Deltaproteobacteria bacterium]
MKFKTIEWKGDHVRLLDQRRLPQEIRYLECRDASSIARAIRNMAIRGAPAIGVAAAMGIALAARKIRSNRPEIFWKKIEEVCHLMGETRPTAVNLFWSIERMRRALNQLHSEDVEGLKSKLEREALRIYREDLKINHKIGENGKILIQDGVGVLTHCNAGGLATAGYGTALGVLRAAWAEGKKFHVYV